MFTLNTHRLNYTRVIRSSSSLCLLFEAAPDIGNDFLNHILEITHSLIFFGLQIPMNSLISFKDIKVNVRLQFPKTDCT